MGERVQKVLQIHSGFVSVAHPSSQSGVGGGLVGL